MKNSNGFIVPTFQRNYEWGEDEYSAFWNDIFGIIQNNTAQYFLGFVVVNELEDQKCNVIDGQQRLSTLSILLSALRAHLLAKEEHKLADELENGFLTTPSENALALRPLLQLNYQDKDYFRQYIVRRTRPQEVFEQAQSDALLSSNQKLAACYKYMHRQITQQVQKGGWTIADLTQAILHVLYEKISLIYIAVPDDIDAFQLFEALNDRGLDLTEADLLKNHIFAIAEGERPEVTRNWETMATNLGQQSTVKFIRHHWMSYYGPMASKGILVNIKELVDSPQKALEYTEHLAETSRAYGALCDAYHPFWKTVFREEEQKIRNLIDAIDKMRAEQLLVVLLAAVETDRELFVDILQMMTVFTFRFTTICGRPPSKLAAPFIKAAQYIREQGKTHQMTAQDVFEQFFAAEYPDDADFQKNFAKKVVRNNANLARYILATLNDHLQAQKEGVASMVTRTDPGKTDLEHILPIRYKTHWLSYKKDFPGGFDAYRYRLGNMTLISTELNKLVGNDYFIEKKQAYQKDCLAITARIVEKERWGAREIEDHQNWMAELAVTIWCHPWDVS